MRDELLLPLICHASQHNIALVNNLREIEFGLGTETNIMVTFKGDLLEVLIQQVFLVFAAYCKIGAIVHVLNRIFGKREYAEGIVPGIADDKPLAFFIEVIAGIGSGSYLDEFVAGSGFIPETGQAYLTAGIEVENGIVNRLNDHIFLLSDAPF